MSNSGQSSLSDLGKWKASNLRRGSEKIIRRAYGKTIEYLARLASFASGGPTRTAGPVSSKQEQLVVEDIVVFSIHARRLIEATSGKNRFRQVKIKAASDLTLENIAIWDLLNRVIHHNEVSMVRTNLKLKALTGTLDIDDIRRPPMGSFPPVVSVASDHQKIISFNLSEFVETFQKDVLTPIIDLCDEHEMFLVEFDE